MSSPVIVYFSGINIEMNIIVGWLIYCELNFSINGGQYIILNLIQV